MTRKILFRAPEFRKIATVVATPAELAKTAEVPDEDVKKIFDTYRNRYITPERRHVEQMPFPTMAEAQAASDRIKGGLTFAALAAERGLKEQDLDLGTVPKSTIIDPAVADAAFSLKDGEVSAPVQGRSAWSSSPCRRSYPRKPKPSPTWRRRSATRSPWRASRKSSRTSTTRSRTPAPAALRWKTRRRN